MENTFRNLVCFFLLLSCMFLNAQNTGITYQAVVRDANGTILQNQSVTLQFDIIRNQASGPVVFTESVAAITDEFGLVSLVIGQQNRIDFNQINWGADNYFLKVSLNGTQIGDVRQFQAVPYSKIATDMMLDNLIDVVSENPAEGNILIFQGGNWQPGDVESISFTAGNGIDITGNTITNTAPDQIVTITAGDNVTIGGTYPDFTISSTDNDTDPSNEFQTLSFNTGNNTLSISDGNSVTIPTGGTDADSDPTNEIQVLSKSGNVVTLSREGGSFTDEVNDNDSDPENEFQTLSLQTNQLTISNGNTVTLPTGTGNSLWTANGKNIFYDSGSISMGKNSAINGLNINNVQYLPSGNLVDVNLPVFVMGNMFVRHDFGSINFGLSIQNSDDRTNVWTFHNSTNPGDAGFDKNLLLIRNSSIVAKIDRDGNYATLSDARFKQNIRPLENITPRLTQLQARSFTMFEGKKTQLGFLAQEVKNIFPEVVDYDRKHDVYMINYHAFGVLAVEAIKEQQQVISSQDNRIDELEDRILRLETLLNKE